MVGGMNALLQLPHGTLYRIPPSFSFDLTIELALTTGVRLLVCGNRLPFYDLAYELARRVGQHYAWILKERIFFARAETVTQLLDFLSELTPDPTPLLVSDLLARFADEMLRRRRDPLFFACQLELQRLSEHARVFVSAQARPPLERLGMALARNTRELIYSSALQHTGTTHGPHPAPLFPAI
jgi:hypothetical protein